MGYSSLKNFIAINNNQPPIITGKDHMIPMDYFIIGAVQLIQTI